MPILPFDTYDKLLKALVDSVGFTGFQISFDEFLSFPNLNLRYAIRDGSRPATTSKMEHFVIIVNGFQQHPRWSALR